MSWSPLLCFIEHFITGFEWWYTTESLLKHVHVAPFIRFLVSIIGFSGVIHSGYMEHIRCDIEHDLTKSELNASIDYIAAALVAALSLASAVIYYYKFGRETLKIKLIYYLIAGSSLITALYYVTFISRPNYPYCTRDIYGQWLDFIFGHFLVSIIYGYWIYSVRQNEKIKKKEGINNENQLSDVIITQSAASGASGASAATEPTGTIVISYPDSGDMDRNLKDMNYDINIDDDSTDTNSIIVMISRIIGVFMVMLYAIYLFFNIFLQFVLINGRIYLLGVVSCFDACDKLRKRYIAEKKRIGLSSFADYLLYTAIIPYTGLKQLTKYLVENEPVKYYFTHGAMVFFQIRYLRYVGSSIADYNLNHPNYTTFDTLYDNCNTTYTRLLPECSDEYLSNLPPIDAVKTLFIRDENKFLAEKSNRLSVFVGFYIRWFTHQFANTNEFKPKKTNAPVGINLSQLYGFCDKEEDKIRSFKDGLLKSEIINGKEFPVIMGSDDFNFSGRKDMEMKEFGMQAFKASSQVDSMTDTVGSTELRLDGFETQKVDYLQLAKMNDKIFLSPWVKVPGVQGVDFFCIQLLFWRHHQWIARQLKKHYPTFDDERIYQITKLCNIITCMQITLSLYGIMGIVQSNISAKFDYYDFENLYNSIPYKFVGPSKLFPCNSTNVYIEFNFMYRWHQLIPPVINIMSNNEYKKEKRLSGNSNHQGLVIKTVSASSNETAQLQNTTTTVNNFKFNNNTTTKTTSQECSGESKSKDAENNNDKEVLERKHDDDDDDDKEEDEADLDNMQELRLPYKNYVDLLTRENGFERFLLSASNTPAGKLSLFNTEKFLCETAVRGTISKSRFYKLESLNNYRERLGFERYDSFEELTDDKILCEKLKGLYNNDIDKLELYVGLFAEDKIGSSIHGPFLTNVFSSIVFSLITSSKLLRKDWNTILTPIGKKIVNKYRTIGDLIELHTDLMKNDVTWKY